MDLATLIGMIGGFAVVMMAILLGGSFMLFVNIPSVAIVIGGSLFVVAMKFKGGQLKSAMTVAGKAFMFKLDSPEEMIEKSIELAQAARKGGGPLGMQNVKVENEFMKKGIDMVVDGFDRDVIEMILEREIDLSVQRHDDGKKIFKSLGDVAPAMGMIGTLIGLVQMLANMSDPAAIGPAMAVALLTTLYGAIIANMVAIPIADKLDVRSGEEEALQSLILDAVLALQKGLHPRLVHDALQNYIPNKQRKSLDDQEKAA